MVKRDTDPPRHPVDLETRARQELGIKTGRLIDSFLTFLGGVAAATGGIVLALSTDVLTPGTAFVMIAGGLAATTFGALELRKHRRDR